uniref:DUF4283 domain-containing protein n=1 Tax=Cucumis melo TaxID=3656 RepID=A0A9I9DN18_CUCME
MDITPDILDWIRNCFKYLLDTTTSKHFFTERRLEDNCMWVRKTKNKSKTSITAEIFRIDKKGRKCSILVPEGPDKFGWKSFLALITFRLFAPTKRIRSEIRKEYVSKYSNSFSSDSDSSRKSYAKALSDSSEEENKKRYKSTSDDSSSRRSTTTGFKPFTLSGESFEKTVIVTRRCFHDDWSRIMFSLKRQSEMEFSYKSFQADKAILYLNPDHAKLLCSNKSANGWSTVRNYQVKFESWDTNIHSFHFVIPSYGGWLSFRGIPLHLWNYSTFQYIGMACGGFLAIAKERMQMEKLIDAKIKVRYNYTGFVPASIMITDDQGENFIITIVPPPKARWFVERYVRVHGPFKSKAANEFDEHNPSAEVYTYNGFQAIPPGTTKSRESNHGQESINNQTKTNAEGEDPNQTNTIKEGAETIHPKGIPSKTTAAGISKDTSIDNEQENDRVFKEKLVHWLKENELKLSPKYTSDVPSSSNFHVIMSDQNVDFSGHGPLGDKGNT